MKLLASKYVHNTLEKNREISEFLCEHGSLFEYDYISGKLDIDFEYIVGLKLVSHNKHFSIYCNFPELDHSMQIVKISDYNHISSNDSKLLTMYDEFTDTDYYRIICYDIVNCDLILQCPSFKVFFSDLRMWCE